MMACELEVISKLSSHTKIDPTEFDVTISALLIGLGAEKYVDIFRKQNIGQCTLAELSDEDLMKLGVDDPEIRQKLIEEVKNLPIYEESENIEAKSLPNLGPIEIVDVLEESGQHLYRMYLSMLANSLALKKTKKVSDCLLYKDKYASDIALATLSEMNTILNSMDIALHTQLKNHSQDVCSTKNKKIIVAALGGTTIVMLGILFIRSLKELK